jgi:hypothetical protein
MGKTMGRKEKSLQEIKGMAKDREKFRRWLHATKVLKGTKGQKKKKKVKEN